MNKTKEECISAIATLIGEGNVTEAITSIRNEKLVSDAKNILQRILMYPKEDISNVISFIEAYIKEEDLLSYKRCDGDDYRSVAFDFSQILSKQNNVKLREYSTLLMQDFVWGVIERKEKCEDITFINNNLYSFKKLSPHMLSELSEEKIGVSSPESFNDPFDCLILSDIRRAFEQNKNLDNFFIDTYIKELRKIRIRCFVGDSSETKGSAPEPYLRTLMWGHYAENHQGICIRYSLSEDSPLLKNGIIDDHTIGRIDKIIYQSGSVRRKERLEYERCFLFKDKAWEYENEVRLVYYDTKRDEEHYSIPLTSIGLKITGVYFGLNCKKEMKSLIRNIMEGQEVDFYEIKCDDQYNNVLKAEKCDDKL